MKKTPILFALLCCAFSISLTVGHSQEILVKDINTNPAGLQDDNNYTPLFCSCGDYLYFIVKSEAGSELWKTDGTESGTVLIKDINAGYSSSIFSSQMTCYENRVYFNATDGTHGIEPFVSDGTASGTYMIKDLRAGPGNSSIDEFLSFQGKLFFFNTNWVTADLELWQTDGSEEGTVLLNTFESEHTIYPIDLVAGGDHFYFMSFLYDPAGTKMQFWSSDGTGSDPVKLKEGMSGGFFASAGGKLFFTITDTGNDLWVSDGSESGTSLVHTFTSYIQGLISFNDKVIFTTGSEVWITDGTDAGTTMLTTGRIDAGVVVADQFYGIGFDINLNTNFLYKTDGTVAGTTKNVDLGGTMGNITIFHKIAMLDNKFIVPLFDDTHGQELGISDGTQPGTVLVKDIREGAQPSNPRAFDTFGNKVFFLANDDLHNSEIWMTDGTPEGTTLLKDIASFSQAGVSESIPSLEVLNDHLYFPGSATDNFMRELWQSDGTEEGTQVSGNFENGLGSFIGRSNSTLFYIDSNVLKKVSASGMEDVKDFSNDFSGFSYFFNQGFILGDKFIFQISTFGLNGIGGEYWTTDGTEAGTVLLKDINPGAGSGVAGVEGIVFNDKFIFAANDGSSGTELWVSDGTEAGTVLLKDIREGAEGSEPNSFVLFNDMVYFTVYRGLNALEFWKTDGTSEGTTLILDMIPARNVSYLKEPVVVGDKMMFSAYHLTRGWEIWKSDGTAEGTVSVTDIIPGDDVNFFFVNFNLFALGDKLLFIADDGIHGNELWLSDGTESSSVLFDVVPGEASSNPTTLRNINGAAYFNAGGKLWRTDGIRLEQVSELEAFEMRYMNDYVYFTAFNANYGVELFKVAFTKSDQTISFDAIPDKLFSDASFDVQASSSEDLPIVFTTDSDKISITGNQVTIIKPGAVTITATQPGTGLYNPAAAVSQTFCVNPSQPVITIEDDGLGFPELTSSSDAGNRWFFNGALIADETANTLLVTQPGLYSVQVVIDECSSVLSAAHNVIITAVDKQEGDLKIFPNPTTNFIRITSQRFTGSDRIEVLDSRGKPVSGYRLTGQNYLDHDMGQYPNGIYFIKVVSGSAVTFKKVVKR